MIIGDCAGTAGTAGSAGAQRAFAANLALLRQSGIAAHVVTQFAFDAAPVLGRLHGLQALEPSLRVRIGLAGPAGIATLARYAERCGIGHSIAALTRPGTSVARLVTEAGLEPMLRQLASADVAATGIHWCSFGGLMWTARWRRAVTDGDFCIAKDKTEFIVAD